MSKPEITGISPFFIVNDVPAALAFYRDRLGFEITFQGPEPNDIFFGIVQRGRAMIMFKAVGVDPVPNYTRDVKQGIARWDAYVHVPDPDALAAEFSSRNVEFSVPLKDTHDGLRGFELKDADGYVLFFGRPKSKETTQATANDEATKVTDKLRDKVKSKIDVAKFFAGFITLLLGYLIKDAQTTTSASRIGLVLLIASLSFCVAALFAYDHLLWPKEILKSRYKRKISNNDFLKWLERQMLRSWGSLFVPAVGCFGFAFYFLLMQKLELINLGAYSNNVWRVALAIAFVLPMLVCRIMWPRMDQNGKSAPTSSD